MNHVRLRISLAVVALLVSAGACSRIDQAPSAPLLLPTASFDKGAPSSDLGADPRTASQKPMATASAGSFSIARCINRVPASYSATFGPAGGVLQFGDSRLIIPGGALRDTVTITATVMDSTTSRVELQPHGLRFAKPAGLQLGTTNCILSNPLYPAIYYLSPEGEVLERIEAVFDPHWGTIASPIDHFSGYAMAI